MYISWKNYPPVPFLSQLKLSTLSNCSFKFHFILFFHAHKWSSKQSNSRPTYVTELYNILCNVNTQHTSRQDAVITIRLYLAKYNLTVIIASFLDVCCVLTVHSILYKLDNTQRDGLSQIYVTELYCLKTYMYCECNVTLLQNFWIKGNGIFWFYPRRT